MSDRERLQRVLWFTVMWICVFGYAFAAGVWCAERSAKEEAPAEPVEYIAKEAMLAGALLPQEKERAPEKENTEEVFLDPLCEDTYLCEELPLSYEEQMLLYGACLEFEIEYPLALAVIEQETSFRNVSGDGGDSQGYMQIQKRWWGELMARIGAEDLTEPEDNFRTGCAILRELLNKHGDLEGALTAYNSGRPGASRYSRAVMERMQKYGQ